VYLFKIAEQLIVMGAKTGAGKTECRLSTITIILKNGKYMGDMQQQKTISVDC
jgi:site-specific DNA recombinase